MKIARFPNGFVELVGDDLRITGGDPVIIPRASIRSVVCRDGKKSLFSRNPPAVLEIEHAAGLDTQRVKLLLPADTRETAASALVAWGLSISG